MPVVFNLLHWLSAILLIVLGCYTFKKATTRTGFLLCSFFLLLSGWALGAALVFNIDGLSTKIELTRMKFMFIPFLSVNVFYITRCFSDKVRLNKLEILAIGTIPALAVIIICSPYHGLLVNHYAIENYMGSDILTFDNGMLFHVYVIHSRIVFLWALYTLVKASINNHLIKRTTWIIFFSILVPLILDTIAVNFFPILRYMQLVPVVLTFTALGFYYVIFKERILELVPIARNQVIDSISDIYLVIDYRDRLVDFNTYAKHALQLNSHHIGKLLKEMGPDHHGILAHLSEMLEQHQSNSIYVVPGYNHKEFYSIRFDSIVNKTSEEMGRVIMVKNITEQKKYETQLAQTVAMRTKFIGIMAHDLIGNVSGHTLFLESLMDHEGVEKDEDLKASLNFLLNSSQNITKFVEGLLSWSRENLHDMQIKKTKTDLNRLINDAIHFLQPIAIQKDIEYNLQIAENSYADIDPDMIQTVFRNIIANAIKVSPESSIITITADIREDLINISIADQGSGLDEKAMNNFLTQLNLDSFNGGFGLTLSRDFIHLHKGFITARNNTPKGAVFSFTLPKLND